MPQDHSLSDTGGGKVPIMLLNPSQYEYKEIFLKLAQIVDLAYLLL